MRASPLLTGVDAVTVPVPDLDAGIAFYRDRLGHVLLWRNDEIGQAGLGLATPGTEIVLSTRQSYAPTWSVESADEVTAGGRLVAGPSDIPVGHVVVVADAFGNELVLVDLSKGRYVTDADGTVRGVR
jgi:catechol 2,3-dioxygenase-like lactoylglutathione lyase family enzyme